MNTARRTFIKRTAAAAGALSLAPHLVWAAPQGVAPLRVGVMGVNSRGGYLAEVFAADPGFEVAYICDVDERATERVIGALTTTPQGADAPLQEQAPQGVTDVRRVLDDPDVDALVIAAPDHWHAPATLMAMDAGKHVYVEKPCSHNPREGELLVAAQQQHPDLVVQMGNQQRSSPRTIQAIQDVRDGLIGRAYYGRAWYANTRGPTHLREGSVPDWLDYELWQGPAPRRPYRDGLIHYDWHWFWHWGTAEICNNGTHEIDLCRWALDVDYPVRVGSAGGRYHYDDDWEAFDTQVATFDFEGEKTIAWEGRSCNGNPLKGSGDLPGGGRGVTIHGTEGTLILDRRGYVAQDNDGNIIKYENEVSSAQTSGTDTVGAGSLTEQHVANFGAAIRGEAEPQAPITEGRKSVLLCHLGNIAQRTGRSLEVDPTTGRPNSEAAMQLWSREYENGWEPAV